MPYRQFLAHDEKSVDRNTRAIYRFILVLAIKKTRHHQALRTARSENDVDLLRSVFFLEFGCRIF